MLLRRLRGLIGMAFVWGVAISAAGTVFIIAAGLLSGFIPSSGPVVLRQWAGVLASVALRDFLGGCVSGTVFAALLASAERRRTLDTLSLPRAAGWGLMGSAVSWLIAVVLSAASISHAALVATTIATGLLGSGFGVGTIRLARRGAGALPAELPMVPSRSL